MWNTPVFISILLCRIESLVRTNPQKFPHSNASNGLGGLCTSFMVLRTFLVNRPFSIPKFMNHSPSSVLEINLGTEFYLCRKITLWTPRFACTSKWFPPPHPKSFQYWILVMILLDTTSWCIFIIHLTWNLLVFTPVWGSLAHTLFTRCASFHSTKNTSFEMDHHQQTVKMEKHQNSDFENTLKHAWTSSIQF